MAIAEIKWKLVKDTYFFDTTTCYLSEDGNHMFYSGGEKRIKILIDDLNELVRKGCAMWLELGEYEFGFDRLSKCPTTTWYSINQKLYSLEPWGVMKESKESTRKSLKEAKNGYYIYTKLDNKYAYCDKSKFTEEGFYLIEDYMLDAIHIFETEKEAEKFIDEDLNRFMIKKDNVVIDEYPSTKRGFFESRKSIKESSDVTDKIASEIDKSYWIDKLIDDLDRHYESMEKAWLKNLDKLSDEDILGIIDDCMGKSKTLVGKSEMLKNKMIDDLSKAYDDYIDDIDRQIRIGKSEDEIKEMIETTLENDIKMYLKLAYNNKASSNYFMVKFAEDNLI